MYVLSSALRWMRYRLPPPKITATSARSAPRSLTQSACCRTVLRKGVLWFLRTPEDPDWDIVQDMIRVRFWFFFLLESTNQYSRVANRVVNDRRHRCCAR
jgi:hypothetical protein